MPTPSGDRLAVHFSSARSDWPTPQDLFDTLHDEFSFTLDAAASDTNCKVPDHYFTEDDDGLVQPWVNRDGSPATVFLNPPYGRGIGCWIEKAIQEADNGSDVVLLVPARFDSTWGQALLNRADEVRHIAGRLIFVGANERAPFPSAVVILRGRETTRDEDRGEVAYLLPTHHDRARRWTITRTMRDAS